MKLEDLLLFLLSLFGAAAMCGARIAWLLFGVASTPPDDGAALVLWERKRRWLMISEFAALPAFALISVLIGRLREWPVEGVVLLSMVLGALGFAFFLDALQTLVRKRMGMAEAPLADEAP
ncbi:hypothetical protein [Novosphingobium clariflavum]|uniref:hypothetical protein n=1 Tax=Novosphingobium clariflavum TaxID=2029884 RepID=UPI002264D6DB|nr:hypothetical protein [Novosphingobium clariflavum]